MAMMQFPTKQGYIEILFSFGSFIIVNSNDFASDQVHRFSSATFRISPSRISITCDHKIIYYLLLLLWLKD